MWASSSVCYPLAFENVADLVEAQTGALRAADELQALDGRGLIVAQPDAEIFRLAASEGRRIVTENIKDLRPLLVRAYNTGEPVAALLLVSPDAFHADVATAPNVVLAGERVAQSLNRMCEQSHDNDVVVGFANVGRREHLDDKCL